MRTYLIYDGKVITHYLIDTEGKVYTEQGDELTAFQSVNGYLRVKLSKGVKRGMYLVHRLVAMTFIDNPNNYPIVHHKDENRSNNSISNLEWCNNSYNQKQRFKNRIGTKAKPVIQLTLDGEVIKEWDTPREVYKELGIQSQNISKVCLGLRNQAGGYKWKYK